MAIDEYSMEDEREKTIALLERMLRSDFFDIKTSVRHIESNPPVNPTFFVRQLSGHAMATAMYTWFRSRDLQSMRKWWYVAAKLLQWSYLGSEKVNPTMYMFDLINPLLSNNRQIIHWFTNFDPSYDVTSVEDPASHHFRAYQAFLALRAEWGRLIERCERVIAQVAEEPNFNLYLNDNLFYLALARRERLGMEQALRHIVQPKAVVERMYEEDALCAGLISTAAVIYAKIAWFHGLEVEVVSPYVPLEWLSMEPLVDYDNRYAFLK